MGMGGLDSPPSLDGLFGADSPLAPDGMAADAGLGSVLDGGGLLGDLGSGLGAEGEMQGDAGIGAQEGSDLFGRVRDTHLRAQQKGLVAGMPKRL